DAEGRSLVGRDYANRLALVSPAPVYGTFASHMERGTMGGAIMDFTDVGRTAAVVVSRVLAGKPPSRPIAVETPDVPLRVNWRALQRWRISPDQVPPDVQIAHRDPGLWDAHRDQVLLALATLLLQALLITGLVAQLRRRRQAQSALRESEEHLRL